MNKIKIFHYNLISHYRTHLMGLSMLWVIFFHSSITINNPIIDYFKNIGYGGVDIFLMLSGLGLYYSYRKNPDSISFYKRRMLRILPTYIPVVLGYYLLLYLVKQAPLKAIFLNVTTLSFWLHSNYMFDWYIPALIVLYFVTPPIIKMLEKHQTPHSKYITIGIFIIISLLISIIIINSKLNYLIIFTSRIPIFLLRILIGYLSESKKILTKKHLLIHLTLLIIGLTLLSLFINHFDQYLWSYGLWWWPFMLITVPLCLFTCLILDYLCSITSSQLNSLKFFGLFSLELYLFHERLLYLLSFFIGHLGLPFLNLMSVILTIILAYSWKKIIDLINPHQLMSRKQKLSQL